MKTKNAIPAKNKTAWRSFLVLLASTLFIPLANAATIGYWQFEEGTVGNPASSITGAIVSTGTANNATAFGGPVYNAGVSTPNPTGSTESLSFTPTGQRVQYSGITGSNFVTVEASVNYNATPGNGAYQMPIQLGSTGAGVTFYLGAWSSVSGDSTHLQMAVYNGGWHYAISSVSIVAGTWYNLAGVYDSTGLSLYNNGLLIASLAYSSAGYGGGTPGNLYVGNNEGGGVIFGNNSGGGGGLIDTVRLSNVGLSAGQLLYAPVPEPGTMALGMVAAGGFFFLRLLRRKHSVA
ncbi:MAG: LamG-like jellyroll fold domain-containing protein [Chthoniobacterales bacterium]